jgi:hypothetical protein
MKIGKSVWAAGAAAISISLFSVGCDSGSSSVSNQPEKKPTTGFVRSSVLLGKVGVLSKAAAISMKKVLFTAISSANDTLRDSSTSLSGSEQITLQKLFSLKALRTWVVSAKSYDQKDSVIHSGSSNAFTVKPGDTADVSLNLTSRFTMYQASFTALPDSISATGTGTSKDKLNLNRLVLKVDGTIKYDSTLASGYFSANQVVNLYFDYVTPGSHTVTLEAYGVLHSFTGMLYTGNSTVNVAAGIDATQSVTLGWVGPSTGTGRLTVVLGRVGKVIVNGTLPGTVF